MAGRRAAPDPAAFRRDYAATLGGELAHNLALFESVDSTNRVARAMAAASLDRAGVVRPFVVAALEQTAGRGRQGRVWSSPPGLGVYLSLVVPACPVEWLSGLPLLAGVALCRGLAPLVPGACRLKWPNDVLVDGRKIAGILIETVRGANREATAVLGVGVNQHHREEELPVPGATSIESCGGKRISSGNLAGRLVEALGRELGRLGEAGYAIQAYEDLSIHRPGDVMICRTARREMTGRFAGFEGDGRLRLETDGGIESLSSAEVWDLPDHPAPEGDGRT